MISPKSGGPHTDFMAIKKSTFLLRYNSRNDRDQSVIQYFRDTFTKTLHRFIDLKKKNWGDQS